MSVKNCAKRSLLYLSRPTTQRTTVGASLTHIKYLLYPAWFLVGGWANLQTDSSSDGHNVSPHFFWTSYAGLKKCVFGFKNVSECKSDCVEFLGRGWMSMCWLWGRRKILKIVIHLKSKQSQAQEPAVCLPSYSRLCVSVFACACACCLPRSWVEVEVVPGVTSLPVKSNAGAAVEGHQAVDDDPSLPAGCSQTHTNILMPYLLVLI